MTINVAEHTECSKPVDRTVLPLRASSARRRRTIDCNRAADRVGPDGKPFWPPPVDSCRSSHSNALQHSSTIKPLTYAT